MSYWRDMASAEEEESGEAAPDGVTEQVWHINLADHLTSLPIHGAHTRCPLCGRPWEQVEQTTLDHVVPDSMGGVGAERAKVCRRCNNRLGGELEGPLLGEQGCLLPFASCNGWAEGRLTATTPDGQAYRWSPSTGDGELRRPSHQVDATDAGRVTLNFSLPESLVGQLADAHPADALRHPYVQRLIREHGPQGVDSTVEVTDFRRGTWATGEAAIVPDLPRLRRLASKVALNAGALVWGNDFVSSGLADRFRDFLAIPRGQTRQRQKPPPRDSEHRAKLADTYGLASDHAYMPYLRKRLLAPARVQHMPPQVHFRPFGAAGEFTWLGVYLLDLELPEIIAPEPFPLTFGESDVIYIELRQRQIKTATVG